MKKFLILALIAFSGCVSSEARNVIGTGAVVGDGNLFEWDQLDDSQKKIAHWHLVRGFHFLDFELNGVAFPEEFAPSKPSWDTAGAY